MDSSLKTLIVGTLLLISLFIIAWVNVQQSWVYQQRQRAILTLEAQQNEIYQENKRLFVRISELESPAHILSLVRRHPEWQLHYIEPSDVILIYPSLPEGK